MLTAVLAALALQTAPQGAEPLVNPTWITPPVFSTGPRTSRGRRASLPEGQVQLSCTASAEGRLTNCRVISEPAPPAALARAALEATETARIEPRRVDGQPVGTEVVFGMTYTKRE
jgi:TonB family protein